MSATSHDAVNGAKGTLRSLDVPDKDVPDAPDYTEDLADEVTSELAPGAVPQRRKSDAARPAAAVAAAADGNEDGARILRDRYRLESQVGNGGTATVYRAVDLRRDAGAADDGCRVAIKLLRPELRGRAHSVARLQREFRQTQAVAHPNVVKFHDLDCDGDAWFIVMELLSGGTLGPLLRRSRPAGLPADEALRIAAAVGDALAHAHGRGVTHGDVKPDNIFLTGAGEVRLFDFGVAPESGTPAEGEGAGVAVAAAATRAYASPEVLSGDAPEPRDDVFSRGCVIHEMVAGRHPYGRHGADRARDAAVVPERLASLGPARAAAVASALSLSRAGRPAMADLVRALRDGDAVDVPSTAPPPAPAGDVAALAPLTVHPPAPAPAAAAPSTAAPAPKRPRAALWAALAAGAALVVGFLIGRGEPGADSAPVAAPAPERLVVAEPPPQPPPPPAAEVTVAPPSAAPAQVEPQPVPVAASGPPGLVFFDGPNMMVSNRAVVAAIPLRHLNHSRRAVNVSWQIRDGSARAGRDYAGPVSGVEPFIEGNSFRILYVPILPVRGVSPPRSFTVELTGVSDGAAIGPTPRVEVTILGST